MESASDPLCIRNHVWIVDHPDDAGRTSQSVRTDHLDADSCQQLSLPARDCTIPRTSVHILLHDHSGLAPFPPRLHPEGITIDDHPLDSSPESKRIADLTKVLLRRFCSVCNAYAASTPLFVRLDHPRERFPGLT